MEKINGRAKDKFEEIIQNPAQRVKARMPTVTIFFFNIVLKVLARAK